MKISNIYFEQAKKQVVFLHFELDQSPMDIFNVVCDGQLVDNEYGPSSNQPVSYHIMYTQVDPKGDKVVVEFNSNATHQENALEERQGPEECQ